MSSPAAPEPGSAGGHEGGDRFVPIAEVVKAVGLKGQCRLYPLLDWYAPLLQSEFLVWEEGTRATVAEVRSGSAAVVVRFEACLDRRQAELLVGRQVGFLSRSYLASGFPKPPGGLPFRYLGREVRQVDGRAVGRVDEVRRYGAQVTLVVQIGGREVLIPAVEPILRSDDAVVGSLVIDPPEGLLDVAGD